MRCPHEPHVLSAVTENRWSDTTRAHVASCEACAAAAGVASFMADLGAAELPHRALPDPALLWLRAQLPPPAAAASVGRPVRLVQLLGYLMVAAAWIGLLASKWSAMGAWVSSWATPSGGAVLFPTLAMCFTLVSSLLVTLALHAVVADEA